MNIPKTIKILSHTVKVVLLSEKRYEAKYGDDSLGRALLGRNEIVLCRCKDQSRQIEILLHECAHFFCGAGDEPFSEEQFASMVGEFMVLMMRDNPEFFADAVQCLSSS